MVGSVGAACVVVSVGAACVVVSRCSAVWCSVCSSRYVCFCWDFRGLFFLFLCSAAVAQAVAVAAEVAATVAPQLKVFVLLS